MARYGSRNIKEAFIPVFKAAFRKAITKESICAGCRGARLVSYNPEVVISKPDIALHTPNPPSKRTPHENQKHEVSTVR